MTGIPRNVIPSVAEGSLLHCDNQHVCTEKTRWPGAASHVAMSVLQGGSLDYARDDDSAKRYQNSAALHYFCAVPPFRISHFEFLIQAKLSFTIKWQHAPRANPFSSFDPRHPDTPRVHSDCDLLPVLSIFGHKLHGIPRFVHRPSKTIFPEQHMYPPRTINISRQCAARLYIPISLR